MLFTCASSSALVFVLKLALAEMERILANGINPMGLP